MFADTFRNIAYKQVLTPPDHSYAIYINKINYLGRDFNRLQIIKAQPFFLSVTKNELLYFDLETLAGEAELKNDTLYFWVIKDSYNTSKTYPEKRVIKIK